MARFFISYTSADRSWALWITDELRAMGHDPHIHESEVRGTNFIRWMREQVRDADYTLCVGSPDYFDKRSVHSLEEFDAARNRAIKEQSDFCRIVLVQPCEVEEFDATTNYRPVYGLLEDDARARLRDFLKDIPAGHAGLSATFRPFPGRVAHNLPFAAPQQFFQRDKAQLFGREDFFEKIHVCYSDDIRRPATAALRGMPGCGKTTIAAAYAHAHLERYRTCWWIHAGSDDAIMADLARLATQLRWISVDESSEIPRETILGKLESDGRGLLLIYDNAEAPAQLEPFLPATGDAHILITSNARGWATLGQEYEVTTWPPEKGGQFLIKRVQNGADLPSAQKLSEDMGGLPLALEMAGAYCSAHGLTLKRYAAMFERKLVQVFADPENAPREYHKHRSAAAAFELAMQPATSCHPAATDLLQYMSQLAPDPIPLLIFEEGAQQLPESFRSALAKGIDSAIRALGKFALVQRPGDDADEELAAADVDVVQLNRALRAIVPAKLQEADKETIRANLIRVLAAVYPAPEWEINTAWDRARLLAPHVEHLLLTSLLPPGCEAVAADLLHRITQFLGQTPADLNKADKIIDRALELRRAAKPEDKARIADILGTKALLALTRDPGDTKGQAVKLAEEALAVVETAFGPNDRRLAMPLITLARVLRDKHDPSPAHIIPDPESLALATGHCERALNLLAAEDSLDRAHALSVYGRVLSRQKRLADARVALTQALEIYQRVCAKVHPAQGRNAVDMAEIMIREGAYEDARIMLDKARHIYAQDEDLQYGIVLCDSMEGWLEKARGRRDKAAECLKRALELAQKVHGPDHAKTKALETQIAWLDKPTVQIASGVSSTHLA